jgi:hypothetical protein
MFNRRFVCIIILLSYALSSFAAVESVCKWYGIAPFCFIGNSCPDSCWLVATNDRGDGLTCWFDQKKYCCCVKQAVDSIINTIINTK